MNVGNIGAGGWEWWAVEITMVRNDRRCGAMCADSKDALEAGCSGPGDGMAVRAQGEGGVKDN